MSLARESCDEDRPTAGFDEFELRGGQMMVGCKCTRNDGMQHECMRAKCMGRPPCLAHPTPTCPPSQPCPHKPVRDDDDDDDGGVPRTTKTTVAQPAVNGGRPDTAAVSVTAAAVSATAAAVSATAADTEDHDRSRDTAAAAHRRRRLRYRDVDQYVDRSVAVAFRPTVFEPCRVHGTMPKAEPAAGKEDDGGGGGGGSGGATKRQ